MRQMFKLVASLFILVGSFSLLLADSAGPICTHYTGFSVSYDFDTNCPVANQVGTVRFSVQDGKINGGDPEVNVDQALTDTWKQVIPEIKNLMVRWDHDQCVDSKKDLDNPAIAYSFIFYLEIPQGDQASMTLKCEEDGHAGDDLSRDIFFKCTTYSEQQQQQQQPCDFSLKYLP